MRKKRVLPRPCIAVDDPDVFHRDYKRFTPKPMQICLNSRDLNAQQRQRIEQYFDDHFSFDGKTPVLVWKEDPSEFILLGFVPRSPSSALIRMLPVDAHCAPVVMFQVHEKELLKIAGRNSRLIQRDLDDPEGDASLRFRLA